MPQGPRDGIPALGLEVGGLEQPHGVVGSGLQQLLELSEAAVDGAVDELVEVAKEVGPIAKRVAEDEVVVIPHHDELVELDAVLGGAVGKTVLEYLAGVGVRS